MRTPLACSIAALLCACSAEPTAPTPPTDAARSEGGAGGSGGEGGGNAAAGGGSLATVGSGSGGAGSACPVAPSEPTIAPVACEALGLVLGADFAADYTCADLGVIPGLPEEWGGLTVRAGDPSTLLIGGSANLEEGALYTVPLARDDECHIAGLAGGATFHAAAPWNDGGVVYGPGDLLLLAQWPVNGLAQYLPGSSAPDRVTDLFTLGVAASPGGLALVPGWMSGAGTLKLASWPNGEWYELPATLDATGLYQLSPALERTTLPGGPEGVVYVPPGSPAFATPALLVTEWTANDIAAYEVDAAGDPLVETRRDVLVGLSGPEGAHVDPWSGDFLFSTYTYVDESRLILIRGFAPPLDPPR